MNAFLSRRLLNHPDALVESILLTQNEMQEHYSGSGWAIVFANGVKIEQIAYLGQIDNIKQAIDQSLEHGDAYIAICSAGELCDLEHIALTNGSLPRINRLYAEEQGDLIGY